jgi:hypothetical protein
MHERTSKGFYTDAMLRTGAIDQYALLRNGRRVKIELGWVAGEGYYVSFAEQRRGITIKEHREVFEGLNQARTRFKALVRAYP